MMLYAKAMAATAVTAIMAALVAIQNALAEGPMTGQDWVTVGIAALSVVATPLAVWGVENKPGRQALPGPSVTGP